jgi:hypothetical protein
MLERLILDRFEYPGFRGCASWCGLALLPRPGGRTVVIATEREDNPGTSVTNLAEELATMVVKTFGLDARKLVWVEHYGPSKMHGPDEDWDMIDFGNVQFDRTSGRFIAFDDPAWRPMRCQDWQALELDPATLFFSQ